MKILLAAIRLILVAPFLALSFLCIWLAVMLGLVGVVISELCDE